MSLLIPIAVMGLAALLANNVDGSVTNIKAIKDAIFENHKEFIKAIDTAGKQVETTILTISKKAKLTFDSIIVKGQEIQQLKKQVDEQNEINERMSKMMMEQNEHQIEITNSLNNLLREIEESKRADNANEDTNDEIAKKSSQINELMMQLEANTPKYDVTKEICTKQAEVNNLLLDDLSTKKNELVVIENDITELNQQKKKNDEEISNFVTEEEQLTDKLRELEASLRTETNNDETEKIKCQIECLQSEIEIVKKSYDSLQQENVDLKKVLDEVNSEFNRNLVQLNTLINTLEGRKLDIFMDGEIYPEIDKLIKGAKKKIYIVSPFVVERQFEKMKQKLLTAVNANKKLKIYIKYGMQDNFRYGKTKENDNRRMEQSRKMMGQLKELLGDAALIEEDNTHCKILLVDDKYLMIGSMNMLSFRGDYDTDDNLHHELMSLMTDVQVINKTKKKFLVFNSIE